MPDLDLVDQFRNYQLARGLSPATVRRRHLTLTRFTPGRDLETVTATDIEAWLASLDVTSQSRGMYLSDIRAFWKWGINHDIFTVDPTHKIVPPKRPNYVPDPISPKALLAAIDAAPERERLMLTLAGFAGLRCAEIAGLRLENVDHESGTLRVVGKGRKTRIVQLHERVAELIPAESFGPVVAWNGKPITPRAVSDRLAAYLRGVGIDATGHKARHSFGTALYAACQDLRLVQEQLGHSSPQTTQAYVATSDADARAAVKKLYKAKPPDDAAA